jgi:hypothetical protein
MPHSPFRENAKSREACAAGLWSILQMKLMCVEFGRDGAALIRVHTDRIRGAVANGGFGEDEFFGGDRLLRNDGCGQVVFARENRWRRVAAHVAVAAGVVHVESAGNVARGFVIFICHTRASSRRVGIAGNSLGGLQ